MNFGALVNMVLDEIDEAQVGNDAGFTDATNNELRRAKNYLNIAYRNIVKKKPDWSWLRLSSSFQTVGGQAAYTTGSGASNLATTANLQKIHLVQVSGYPPMARLSYEEFKRRYGGNETESGLPFCCYELGGSLYLYPTPGNTYTVNYVVSQKPTDMAAFTDVPLLPAESIEVLAAGGIILAKDHDNEQTMWTQIYQDGLTNLLANENNNHIGYQIVPECEERIAEDYSRILLQ